MTRHRAALIHFILSIMIAGTALTLMLLFVFPAKYFLAGGGSKLLIIMVSVDIIIGPLLTWIVYRQGKKSLTFDLSVIVMLQLAALVYGITVMINSRPVFMALVTDRFSLVQANQISDDLLHKAIYPEFRTRSWTGPIAVVTRMPQDPDSMQTVMMNALAGFDRDKFPELYHPYDENSHEALLYARNVSGLITIDPAAADRIDPVMAEYGLTIEQVDFLPLVTSQSDMTTLLNSETGEILAIVDVDPWQTADQP